MEEKDSRHFSKLRQIIQLHALPFYSFTFDIWHSEDRASRYILTIKATELHNHTSNFTHL
jgi:hypothetical protein